MKGFPRGAVAQLVRVPVCHTGGRGFEPRQPRKVFSNNEIRALEPPATSGLPHRRSLFKVGWRLRVLYERR